MKNVCNKIRLKMKITDLKAFTYADDIIRGHNVKELKIRLTHWEGHSKKYGLQKKFKGSNGKLIKKERKNTIMKINEMEIKQVNRFTYLGKRKLARYRRK
jgi:hypothetical protein